MDNFSAKSLLQRALLETQSWTGS